jgi:protein-S-isoprenylcysteine O-methyltransferase Ste14
MAEDNFSKTKKHHERPDLVGEHRLGDLGQLLFALLFLAVWIADSFVLKLSTFLNPIVPLLPRTILGVGFCLIAWYLSRQGLNVVFKEQRAEAEVISTGVFRFMRHPIYFSEVLLYLGLLMFSLSLLAVVVWVFAIIFLYFLSRYEERLLLEAFGQSYRDYMTEVPMWIPCLFCRQRQA